jgi:hypothetical protein
MNNNKLTGGRGLVSSDVLNEAAHVLNTGNWSYSYMRNPAKKTIEFANEIEHSLTNRHFVADDVLYAMRYVEFDGIDNGVSLADCVAGCLADQFIANEFRLSQSTFETDEEFEQRCVDFSFKKDYILENFSFMVSPSTR